MNYKLGEITFGKNVQPVDHSPFWPDPEKIKLHFCFVAGNPLTISMAEAVRRVAISESERFILDLAIASYNAGRADSNT